MGFSPRDALPGLRSDAADRVAGRGRLVTWPLAFLHRVAESARMALRELDRLEAAAAQGREVVAGGDKRARLPDALDALLRTPALTPKALAAGLKVTPQTGTALLRELQGGGVVREVTGRGSFRAFATTRAARGCRRLAMPPKPSRSDRVAVLHVTLVRRGSHPS